MQTRTLTFFLKNISIQQYNLQTSSMTGTFRYVQKKICSDRVSNNVTDFRSFYLIEKSNYGKHYFLFDLLNQYFFC